MDMFILILQILTIYASICHCYDDDSFIDDYFNIDEQIDHDDYPTTSISLSSSSSSTRKPQQNSFWSTSLFSLFESLLKSVDKTTTNQIDPILQKLEPGSNDIIENQQPSLNHMVETDSNSIKFTTKPMDTISDYDEEDREFFEYNLPDYENDSDNKTNNEYIVNKGECETIHGSMGECRSTPICLKREPKQSVFNLCEWSQNRLTGTRIPIKLCCEKLQSSTPKDLNNEADIEEQWQKQLALGFGNGQTLMGSFWNIVPHPMATVQNSLISHPFHHYQVTQPRCGQTMFNRNHRRQQFMRYVFELPDRRMKDLESDDRFQSLFNQSSTIRDSRSHSQRIVSGVSVANGEIPWIVSIYLRDTFTCGGSLISDRFVLTAAHCFNSAKLSDWFYIRYGSNVVHEGPAVPVKRVILHPNYKPPVIYHDIALLELTHPVQFTSYVLPACLATPRMYAHNLIGMKATVAGYGDSNFEGKQSEFLQAVDIKVIENQFCDKNYRRLAHADQKFRYGIGRTLICAGFEQGIKDACQGDSGGPLTLQLDGIHYQIGVVSFGYRCAQPDFPGIYTAVSHYRQWIMNHLQQQQIS